MTTTMILIRTRKHSRIRLALNTGNGLLSTMFGRFLLLAVNIDLRFIVVIVVVVVSFMISLPSLLSFSFSLSVCFFSFVLLGLVSTTIIFTRDCPPKTNVANLPSTRSVLSDSALLSFFHFASLNQRFNFQMSSICPSARPAGFIQ